MNNYTIISIYEIVKKVIKEEDEIKDSLTEYLYEANIKIIQW